MRAIQLYETTPEEAIEREVALMPNPDCQRCGLCDDASSVCMRAAGEPGGILLVGDYPGAVEDKRGVPFTGQTGRFLHRYVSSIYTGPIAVDNAVRCYPKKEAVGKEEIDACRGYLAHTVRLVKPTRIVAMGGKAIQGVLGRAVPLMSVRRGYGWLYNTNINDTGDPIPVFELFNPVNSLRNKFMRKMFEADLKWALTCKIPEAPPWEEDCYVIESREDSELACSALRAAQWFAYDCEAVGVQYKDDYAVIALAACARGSSTVYVWDRIALYNPNVLAPLTDLLQDPSVGKAGQNLKYDSHAVDCAFKIKLQNYVGDARLQRRLLAADVDASLDVLAELVGLGGIKHEAQVELSKAQRMLTAARKRYKADPEGQTEVLKDDDPILLSACINHEEKPKTYTYGLINDTVMLRYNARDALTTARACELMEARLDREPVVKRVWAEIVSKANFSIKTIERWGIPTRQLNVKRYQSHLDRKMQVIKARFDQYEGLKLNSPKSVGDLLYKQLGLQAPKTTSTGESSTDHETLEALRGQHAVVDDLLEWRRLGKLHGFAKGIERHVCSDGRIHPSIKIDGTRTGRLSCNEPNLQNISRPKDEDAKFARDLFVAEPGWELLEVDYSQLELRVASMLCQDPKMLAIWQSGVDYHQRTAELISQVAWGIPPSAVTKEHRSKAKVPNFGVIYGMTAKGLATKLGCSVREAEKIINAIKGEFVVFDKWCKAQVEMARQTGFVWTWWAGDRARRRPLFDVASNDSLKRSNAENGAVNCLDSETEALTQRGWVKGFDLQMCDRIMTKNPTTGELEWQSPTDLRFFPDYEGELYEFKSRSFHAITTPDHRWLVRDKNSGNDIEKTTKNISLHGDHRIHRTGEFSGEGVSLYSDDFIRLVGWWLTDGYRKRTRKVLDRLGKRGPKPTKQRIGLTQSCRANLEKVRMISALLERLQINPTIRDIEWSKCRQWEWSDKYSKKLVELFPSRELTTEFVFMLGRRQAEILLETMMLGDGHNGHKRTFVSGSAKQAEAFQALAVLCGIASSIIKRDMRKYTPKSSKLWKGQSPHGTSHWQVTLLRRDKVQVLGRQCKRFRAKASVWCPVVPNTFFVARRSGHVFITGNTPVQGTASDFCLASITEIVPWLIKSNLPAELVLTVHDSIMFHARSDVMEEVAHNAQRIMTQWESAGVPLVVDMKRGESWGSLEDYTLAA